MLSKMLMATKVYGIVIYQGAVNPFALANDKENKVKVIVDKKMYGAKTLTFHPMQNDALTEISVEDFKKFLKEIGKTEIIIDFAQIKNGMIAYMMDQI